MNDGPFAGLDARLLGALGKAVDAARAERKTLDPIVLRLTAERSQQGMSLRAVARLADVPPSCVHSWERGTRMPSLANMRAWAGSLGYDLTLTRVTPPVDRSES